MFLTLLSYSFPSRFVLGRSRGEAMADRRKDELNAYVWHLIHSAAEVAQVFPSCYSQHTQSIFRICVNRGEKRQDCLGLCNRISQIMLSDLGLGLPFFP